jgi:hypothetical protein
MEAPVVWRASVPTFLNPYSRYDLTGAEAARQEAWLLLSNPASVAFHHLEGQLAAAAMRGEKPVSSRPLRRLSARNPVALRGRSGGTQGRLDKI